MEDRLDEAFFHGIRKYLQLGHTIFFSVPTSQKTYLALVGKFAQMTDENWLHFSLATVKSFWTMNFSWKQKIVFFASNKLQSTLQAILTLIIYPWIFVASFECLDSPTVTGKRTFCTTFKMVVQFGRVIINKWKRLPVTG